MRGKDGILAAGLLAWAACSGDAAGSNPSVDALLAPQVDAATTDAGTPDGHTAAPCTIYDADAGIADGPVARYESPEAILDDTTVAPAIAAVQRLAAGAGFHPSLGSSPTDITGTWTVPSGTVVATSTGAQVGATLAGSVARVKPVAQCSALLEEDGVASVNGMQLTTSVTFVYLRGSGQDYTTLGITAGTCTVQGSHFMYFLANIVVGQKKANGTAPYDALLITLATEGTLTTACKNALLGTLQQPGEWALVSATPTLSP